MGRIRTKDIKVLSKDLYDIYPDNFSTDFEQNKKIVDEMGILKEKSKRYRNRVAGYVVRIARKAKRIS